MHTTNYFNTFIRAAEDCPIAHSEVPPAKDPMSVAQIQYKMLSEHPYEFTSDDVIYASNGERRGISRDEYFSRGQACFRSSPLTKRYGWGIHSNSEGRIAIYPMDSQEYQEFMKDVSVTQLRGTRSKRA